jgi:hypothetical protein
LPKQAFCQLFLKKVNTFVALWSYRATMNLINEVERIPRVSHSRTSLYLSLNLIGYCCEVTTINTPILFHALVTDNHQGVKLLYYFCRWDVKHIDDVKCKIKIKNLPLPQGQGQKLSLKFC